MGELFPLLAGILAGVVARRLSGTRHPAIAFACPAACPNTPTAGGTDRRNVEPQYVRFGIG